jgi:acyl-coenzyme A synthetase/AMP-(fatty) acid ligase
VTFLAILAHEAIALPLPHSFPASELRYLLENSDSKLLLSTSKLATKAKEILKEGILHKPVLSIIGEVERASSANNDSIEVNGTSTELGGVMLYTSGTTSRPVRSTSSQHERVCEADLAIERCGIEYVCHHRPGEIIDRSVEVHKS